ncbi:MAG: hypothetical protein JWN86_3035 [Planctomycetota bacterium]|nr:hypothetical protein [Planctomycetota bacterium]
MTCITFSVVSQAVLRLDPLPDRAVMMQCACFESLLYAAGFGLSFVSLAWAPMGGARRAVLSILWVVGAFAAFIAAAIAVIDCFP